MSDTISDILAASIQRLLRPLVGILLRHGIAYGQFAEWCRKAYVDVAFSQKSLNGKKSTISSVSAVTGLTRKETRRLYQLQSLASDHADKRYSRATKVISAWVEDPLFNHSPGQPKVLPLSGENSFARLVKDHSGDIPATAMLTVLESAGCVEVLDDTVTLIKRAYIPGGKEASLDKLNILGTDTSELLATIHHNLQAAPEDLLFQRKVYNSAISEEAAAAFKSLAAEKSQQLLEEFHAWLIQHEVDRDIDTTTPNKYVAVGIYYSEHKDSEHKDSEHKDRELKDREHKDNKDNKPIDSRE